MNIFVWIKTTFYIISFNTDLKVQTAFLDQSLILFSFRIVVIICILLQILISHNYANANQSTTHVLVLFDVTGLLRERKH